ncbi:MAG: hydantoinase/oxoprolinase N-terminal domain-containing protein, partial [Vulcanisaeta sp.]
MTKYKVGIDVGSTHTDAVILDENNNLIHAEKTMTTPDVTSGIINALKLVLERSSINKDDIAAVMFGTTHIINAIVQRRGLGRVGVIRIGLPATEAIEPMLDWPADLREVVNAGSVMVRGGHDYTGEPITAFDEDSVRRALEVFREKKVEAVAVTSVWSVVNPEHEARVRDLAKEIIPDVPVVLSHEISS